MVDVRRDGEVGERKSPAEEDWWWRKGVWRMDGDRTKGVGEEEGAQIDEPGAL